MHNYCVSVATFTLTPPYTPLPFKHLFSYFLTYYLYYLTAKKIKRKYLATVGFHNFCCTCEVKNKEVTLFFCRLRILYRVVIKGIIVTVWFYTGMLSQTILWSPSLSLKELQTTQSLHYMLQYVIGQKLGHNIYIYTVHTHTHITTLSAGIRFLRSPVRSLDVRAHPVTIQRETERQLLIVMWGSRRIDPVLTHSCSY